MSLPTTYLFVPGNRPDRFDKALNSGADAIILDLEDAVDPASKDAAREAVGAWLDSDHATDGRVLIRINDDTSPWYGGDCTLLDRFSSVGIVLPIGVAVLALMASRAASLQASTGLLYIGLALVMAGSIAGTSLAYLTGVPV